MEITVPNRQVDISRATFAVTRLAISAAALYALFVVAPVIYSSNEAIRAFSRETIRGEALRDDAIARLREQHQLLLMQARLTSPNARKAFLSQGLNRANVELEGCKHHIADSLATVRCLDTIFHRATFNKHLALARAQRRQNELFGDLAQQNVDRISQVLRTCP